MYKLIMDGKTNAELRWYGFCFEFKTEAAAVTARDWFRKKGYSAEVVVDMANSDQAGDFVEG